MLCLITTVLRHGKSGAAVYRDRLVNAETIGIGRGVEQAVFLPDVRAALQHALIRRVSGGRVQIDSQSPAGIRVNEQLVQSALLRPGDLIRIGNSIIQVAEREGFDLVLEVETKRSPRDIEPHIQARAPLQLGKNRVRTLSWLLFSLILLLFLLIPSAYRYFYDELQPWVAAVEALWVVDKGDVGDAGEVEAVDAEVGSGELPQMPLLLSDRFWDSGTLASVHHFFRQDCSTCHTQPFVPTTDAACISCHDKTHPHTDPDFNDLDKLKNTRCTACHADHNGKKGLIIRDDKLCSECHKDLQAQGVDTDLDDAEDFGTHHPPFRPTLISHQDGKDVEERVSIEDTLAFREQSNLEFPHDVHLSRKGLSTFYHEDNVRLWCDNCHEAEPGGNGFLPINFERHCQDCHRLSFEPMEIDRVVPHGKVGEVMHTLQDYYSTHALAGDYHNDPTAPQVVQMGRFPGERLEGEERMVALNWAQQKAEEVAQEVFEFTLCIECHRINQVQEDPPRWDIVPVRINANWLRKARFSHQKHLTMNCVSCHLAPESNNSSEILLPDLSICQNCHGGVNAPDKLQSTCVDCHGFHVAKEFTMGKDAEMDTVSTAMDSSDSLPAEEHADADEPINSTTLPDE